MPVDKDMSLTEAAAIPEVWLTAYQLINFVGEYWFKKYKFLNNELWNISKKSVEHIYTR